MVVIALRPDSMAAAILIACVSTAHAQSTRPTTGLTMQGPADQAAAVIKDGLGRPCLDVEAAARRETINPDMLEHVVSLKNNCPRLIKVKVCYYNSDQCKQLDVLGYKRVDTVLGVMKGIKYFRYVLTQK